MAISMFYFVFVTFNVLCSSEPRDANVRGFTFVQTPERQRSRVIEVHVQLTESDVMHNEGEKVSEDTTASFWGDVPLPFSFLFADILALQPPTYQKEIHNNRSGLVGKASEEGAQERYSERVNVVSEDTEIEEEKVINKGTHRFESLSEEESKEGAQGCRNADVQRDDVSTSQAAENTGVSGGCYCARESLPTADTGNWGQGDVDKWNEMVKTLKICGGAKVKVTFKSRGDREVLENVIVKGTGKKLVELPNVGDVTALTDKEERLKSKDLYQAYHTNTQVPHIGGTVFWTFVRGRRNMCKKESQKCEQMEYSHVIYGLGSYNPSGGIQAYNGIKAKLAQPYSCDVTKIDKHGDATEIKDRTGSNGDEKDKYPGGYTFGTFGRMTKYDYCSKHAYR